MDSVNPNNPPTSQDGLLKLEERCEQATGPDEALDEAIRVTLGLNKVLLGFGPGLYPDDDDYGAAPFTASLDAAMTLVPEGASIDLRTGQTFPGALAMVHPTKMRPTITCRAATPALALCAAALKARASQ